MKTTILILKGIYFYMTVLLTLLVLAYNLDDLFPVLIAGIFLFGCKLLITKEELDKIMFINFFKSIEKKLGLEEEDEE